MSEKNKREIGEIYRKAYVHYKESLNGIIDVWDYVFLTAADEAQADMYRNQIDMRLERGELPFETKFVVLADPDGKRVGSGGATLNVLRFVKSEHETFEKLRIMVIHSGGDCKRIPHYCTCGKLFLPIPRKLPEGRNSTLFDEITISMAGVPSQITEGMLVCAGDVLCIFNSEQVGFSSKGATAVSIKEKVHIGKNHGVFLCDEKGSVDRFLHKQPVHKLREAGASNEYDEVDIDTGMVLFGCGLLEDMFGLIDSEGSFIEFVNENVSLSFYADFLYPLASSSTLEEYLGETPEGEFSDGLSKCRLQIWDVMKEYEMEVTRLSPAAYIHLGTTRELVDLMNNDKIGFDCLGWKYSLGSNSKSNEFTVRNSYIHPKAKIGKGSYIEDSFIGQDSVIGKECIISGLELGGEVVPKGTVLHGMKLVNGNFVARMYGIDDNPKVNKWFDEDQGKMLWTKNLFPVCNNMKSAVGNVLKKVNDGNLISLKDSARLADINATNIWNKKVEDRVKANEFIENIDNRISACETIKIFENGISEFAYNLLIENAAAQDIYELDGFFRKLRIFYYLNLIKTGQLKKELLNKCFEVIKEGLIQNSVPGLKYNSGLVIKEENIRIELPVRVNWGGGWSDTPPTCMELGGTVINASISINGRLPVRASIKRINELKLIFESTDCNEVMEISEVSEIQDCNKKGDMFSLHKAALMCTGVIPINKTVPLVSILERMGGGIRLSTEVCGIPKGSGLGTSSILASACVKAIFSFFGIETGENDIFSRVLCLEQMIGAGGGWQDQVGGMTRGIKLITSKKGLHQVIDIKRLILSSAVMEELNSRFCLIYSGFNRQNSELHREAVSKIIRCDSDRIKMIRDMKQIAADMKTLLENGEVDAFADLLSAHWCLYKNYNEGSTNRHIIEILESIEDLISGKMMCGAGGGGFIQVILKKGITKDILKSRIASVFGDSEVKVWETSFIM